MTRAPVLTPLGGRPQLVIQSPQDLIALLALPPEYWMVNSIPVTGLSGQSELLNVLDIDQKSRITPLNIIHAVEDLVDGFVDLSGCIQQSKAICSSNFNPNTSLGQALSQIAQTVLQQLECSDTTAITRSDIQKIQAKIQGASVNGDGILPIVAAQSEDARALIQLGIQIHGKTTDSNGHPGIRFANLPKLPHQIQAWQHWKESAPTSLWNQDMVAIVKAIHSWIDQHFVSRQQPTTVFTSPHLCAHNSPIALTPEHWVHPGARTLWQQFWEQICAPLQIHEVTWQRWEQILAQSIEWDSWYAQKPEGNFDAVDPTELEYWTTHSTQFQASMTELSHLMAVDNEMATQLQAIHKIDRILLLQAEIVPFLNSTINFSAFYDPTKVSLPEIGHLLMDGRVFGLSVHVQDIAQHKKQAAHSGFCLLYVKVNAPTPFTVSAAVTGNTRGDLHICKKGVFTDLQGHEYPAEIIDLVDAPITVFEAFLEPLQLIKSRVKDMADKLANEQQSKIQETIPVSSQTMMTGGVTFAALSSSLAYVTKTIVSIKLQSMLVVLLAPLLVLGVVSSIRAGWKLYRRDLGPILEASGWGINHPVPAPEWAANVFTNTPQYSSDTIKDQSDLLHTFERVVEPKRPIKKLLAWIMWIVLTIVLWQQWSSLMDIIHTLAPESK